MFTPSTVDCGFLGREGPPAAVGPARQGEPQSQVGPASGGRPSVAFQVDPESAGGNGGARARPAGVGRVRAICWSRRFLWSSGCTALRKADDQADPLRRPRIDALDRLRCDRWRCIAAAGPAGCPRSRRPGIGNQQYVARACSRKLLQLIVGIKPAGRVAAGPRDSRS